MLIARAVCQDAKVLIMDEPGASLDYANQQLLINVLMNLASQGYGIILSTHSPEHPFSVAQVLLMKEGRVAAFGPPEEAITRETLEGVYGIAWMLYRWMTGEAGGIPSAFRSANSIK